MKHKKTEKSGKRKIKRTENNTVRTAFLMESNNFAVCCDQVWWAPEDFLHVPRLSEIIVWNSQENTE
jgi:hypothetical protein